MSKAVGLSKSDLIGLMMPREMSTINVKKELRDYMDADRPEGLAWWRFMEIVYYDWADAPPEYRSLESQER